MKLLELKPGDRIMVNDNGVERLGTVARVSTEDHEVCVNNGVQEFWYKPEDVRGIALNDAELMALGFERKDVENGVKYGKDAFRLVVPAVNDFTRVEVWYRDDHRHFDHPLMLHELQNLYLQMTKMPLG